MAEYDDKEVRDKPKKGKHKLPDMRKKDNQKLLEKIKGRWKAMSDADQENRREAMEDMKFCFVPGNQWDLNMKQERGQRPAYEFNKVRISVKRVINDMRANRPAGKVRAIEGGDKETAELYEGLIRNISNRSEFETITDYAAEYQVAGGFAAWRVDVDYADDDIFDQDIWVRGIENPYCLYHDPAAKDFMKRDAEDWILTERITHGEFERRFGEDAEKSDFQGDIEFDDEDWADEDDVRIAEYWYKKPVTKELWQLQDGTVVDSESDEAKAIPPEAILKTREVMTNKICRVMASGQRLLTEPEDWAGRKFPFVVVYGEYIVVDGKTQWHGLVRHAKDAQRSYNVARTSVIENIAQAPKSKILATAEQVAGLEQQWQTAHKKNYPFMLYNSDPNAPGPPQMLPGPSVPSGLAAEQQFASDDLKAVTGIFDASIGARGNETSGRAIYARQQQGEIATFNYQDNMSKAVQYTYEILIDLIPEIYDAEREIRVLGSDGAEDYKRINQVVMDYETMTAIRVNDITTGKYDVTVTSGPNFATQRQEAAETYSQLAQGNPEIMSIAGDLVFKSMDLPYAEDIGERLKFLLPPQVQESLGEDKEVPPEVQQMMAQAQEAMQMVEQRAQEVAQLEQQASESKSQADAAQSDIRAEIANLKAEKAEFEAHVAKQMAALVQKESQIIVKEAGAELKMSELTGEVAEIQQQERESAAVQIESIDNVLSQFMQAVDSAVGSLDRRAAQINRAANRQVVSGSTRRENGQLVADVNYDDGTSRQVRAKRENGEIVILPTEADGGPEPPA
jgi:hypothetical protein